MVGADAHVVLAADLAVRDQRVGAVAAPLPPVPGADDVFALHRAADAHVGAEVLTVGVQHVHLAGLGAKQHHLLAEVVRTLDLTDGQVGCERDDEPPRREPVGGQGNAALTELAVPTGPALKAFLSRLYLRPDGKTQVTIEYAGDKPVRLDTVVVSTQHAPDINLKELLAPDVKDYVVDPVLASFDIDTTGFRLLVNPTGRFEIGGPMGDAGLTGRKIIIDTYGGMARHGGGAFSGKDPSKVDRSAAYAMRWVAKNVVAADLADRCEAQVAYAIGKAKPVGLFIECFGTEKVPVERIQDAVTEVFDLRPRAIIADLDLLRPIYSQTAAYGHFGRTEPDFTWERTDRAALLRAAAGL